MVLRDGDMADNRGRRLGAVMARCGGWLSGKGSARCFRSYLDRRSSLDGGRARLFLLRAVFRVHGIHGRAAALPRRCIGLRTDIIHA
jgi:hypothetical protein